jgi:hypothetical protein
MTETKQRETMQQRVARIEQHLTEWRKRSAYVLLCSDGHARSASVAPKAGKAN